MVFYRRVNLSGSLIGGKQISFKIMSPNPTICSCKRCTLYLSFSISQWKLNWRRNARHAGLHRLLRQKGNPARYWVGEAQVRWSWCCERGFPMKSIYVNLGSWWCQWAWGVVFKPFLKVTADQIEAVYDKLREKNDRITRYVLDITNSVWNVIKSFHKIKILKEIL